MSNSRLEPLNRTGVKVGQCVSPAPSRITQTGTRAAEKGVGETHCPTLRFMERVGERGTHTVADEGRSGFPTWRHPLPDPHLQRRRGRSSRRLVAVSSASLGLGNLTKGRD